MSKNSYTNNYDIIKPYLKSNITGRPVKVNSIIGNFEDCFSRDVLEEFNLKSTSFDFFILWNEDKTNGDLNKSLWFKRVIEFDDSSNTLININNEFIRKLTVCDSEQYIEDNLHFLSKYNLNGYYMIIKDWVINDNFICKNTPIALSLPLLSPLLKKNLNIMTLEDIEKSLIDNSGGEFSINKPLNYSTTSLEYILAKNSKETGALWPGDCDLIIFDEKYECKMILEFKKCTQYGNIPIEDQSFDNYKGDTIKYKRLAILRDYLSELSNDTVPLLTIFYPTTDEKFIKIQSIDGTPSNLYEINNKLLEIPSSKNDVDQFKRHLITELLKFN